MTKLLRAAVLLVLLSACGGGDDVTSPPPDNPPETESFTLTVTGGGSGSGRVTTPADIQPGLACDLAENAAPSGVCSATYPEGTVVALNVAPEEGSTFTGWAGDAGACGTTPSCSINMSENQDVAAQFSSALAGLEVVSSAFYPEPVFGVEGAVIWVVEVRNVTSQLIESAEVGFSSRDAAGEVLAVSSTFIGPIPPGETRVGQSFAEYLGTEASADFQVVDVRFATAPSRLGEAEIVSSNWRIDSEFAGDGAVVWTVEVRNTTSAQLETVQVEFSTYDAAGKIIAADFAFLDAIPPGETRAAEGFADYRGTEATAKFQVATVE
jgi:uncharacterized repeat protein (TIGR02543 family)